MKFGYDILTINSGIFAGVLIFRQRDCSRFTPDFSDGTSGVSSSALFSPALVHSSLLSAFLCMGLVHVDYVLSP